MRSPIHLMVAAVTAPLLGHDACHSDSNNIDEFPAEISPRTVGVTRVFSSPTRLPAKRGKRRPVVGRPAVPEAPSSVSNDSRRRARGSPVGARRTCGARKPSSVLAARPMAGARRTFATPHDVRPRAKRRPRTMSRASPFTRAGTRTATGRSRAASAGSVVAEVGPRGEPCFFRHRIHGGPFSPERRTGGQVAWHGLDRTILATRPHRRWTQRRSSAPEREAAAVSGACQGRGRLFRCSPALTPYLPGPPPSSMGTTRSSTTSPHSICGAEPGTLLAMSCASRRPKS